MPATAGLKLILLNRRFVSDVCDDGGVYEDEQVGLGIGHNDGHDDVCYIAADVDGDDGGVAVEGHEVVYARDDSVYCVW